MSNHKPPADLSGVRFGRLVAMDLVGRSAPNSSGKTQPMWSAACDCGVMTTVRASSLKYGNTTSCGCRLREIREDVRTLKLSHGLSGTREYRIWSGMITRCSNPNVRIYPRYGGRSILVYGRWSSFENFIHDMGPCPSPKHEIDRIDNDGNYEPGNCRWATRSENMRNTSVNRVVELRGRTLTAVELGELGAANGVPPGVVKDRIRKGWVPERAYATPLKRPAMDRCREASDLRAAGATFATIAMRLGVSMSHAHRMCRRAVDGKLAVAP